MAREGLTSETGIDALASAIHCIDNGNSFLVEAGAGSGKTWTLVESLKYIIAEKSESLKRLNQKIVCITYTNIAKNEIAERIERNPIAIVLTIHEFLWDVIRNFQNELKKTILVYNKESSKTPIDGLEQKLKDIVVEYSQFGRKFEKGKIAHEDVIEFSSKMFSEYPKLSKIVAKKYPYIFIDEYQDTDPRTVNLLLNDLLKNIPNELVVGFYGDSMQKIYNQGVGSISSHFLTVITKTENYRCSLKVIGLLNKMRTGLTQKPSGNNLLGDALFFFGVNSDSSNGERDFLKVYDFLLKKKEWATEKTKILFLTHKGIASKLGYEKLLEAYSALPFGREKLTEKQEPFSDFLLNKVEPLFSLYKERKYGQFMRLLGIEGFKVQKHQDKIHLQNLMDSLEKIRLNGSVKDVIEFVFKNEILSQPVRLQDFIIRIGKSELDDDDKRDEKFFQELMNVKYREVIKIYEFVEEFTPFSTKHGVKGAEFENVLVVIDDSLWNQYKFNDVFANDQSNKGRYSRTLNLLYVCCSRAKDKLALISLSEMNAKARTTIGNWFGPESVHEASML
jgi:DNA helicase-2/ATP-dependent DNA helicase PcrA